MELTFSGLFQFLFFLSGAVLLGMWWIRIIDAKFEKLEIVDNALFLKIEVFILMLNAAFLYFGFFH